ncbi:MAG: cholesterol esterase [Icmadophila ericetorum]|nr:cholesterol esterase [Icmadophila ericetorum]
MARVPFIGRLFWREYLALCGSFILIFLEGFIRVITLGLPQPIIQWFYNRSKFLFNFLSSPQGRHSRSQKKSISSSIAHSSDFVDLCALYGYYAEEHVVQTGDGYLLGLHRLGWKRGEEGTRVNAGEGSLRKKVIYMHHGLLMNSEVWVCITERERCLPLMLVEQGYDVWLGNNRGNKYSKKSTRYSPNSTDFWNFSMDQFAFHDIPDSIAYVLETTSQPSLSYIGFSQGTAQAFATLSIHPTLNDKVDVFIALAPAMSPAGLSNGIVDALVKASPEVIFLAFGRRSILSSATMWQALLYPPIFVRIIDMSLSFLFGWTAKNISTHQKLAAYPHLYSFTSTKSVVHWFQIIRTKSFQMYDDDVQAPLSLGASDRYYKVAKFPTRNIKTPIVLIYGGSDSLVDIKVMLKELPRHTIAKEIPHFEHLDFLWAQEIDTLVFPHVFSALEEHAGRDHLHYRHFANSISRHSQLLLPQSSEFSEDDTSLMTTDTDLNASPTKHRVWTPHARYAKKLKSAGSPMNDSSPSSDAQASPGDGAGDSPSSTITITKPPSPHSKSNSKKRRSGSLSSSHGIESPGVTKKIGQSGISIGSGRATVGGVSVTSPRLEAEEKQLMAPA